MINYSTLQYTSTLEYSVINTVRSAVLQTVNTGYSTLHYQVYIYGQAWTVISRAAQEAASMTLQDLDRYTEGVSRHTGTQAHRHSQSLDSYLSYI